MAKSAVVKVVADTKAYDRSIDQAARKLNDFGKNGVGSLTSLMGAWGKLVPAIGAAVGAYDLFERALNSSQTLTDAWGSTMEAAKSITDEFAYSIANFDFSVMEQGLSALIGKAREYYAAMDQLGNTTMSYNIITSKENAELQEQLLIVRDTTKSLEERNAAIQKAKESRGRIADAGDVLQGDVLNVMRAKISSTTTLAAGDITMKAIEKALMLDATKGRDAAKEIARQEYEAYTQELRAVQSKYGNSLKTTTTMYGTSFTTGSAGDPKKLTEETSKLNAKYQDSVVLHTLLTKYSDEELKALGEQYSTIQNINQTLTSTEKSIMRASSSLSSNSGGGGGNKKTPAVEGTIRWYEERISDLNKSLGDAVTEDVRATLRADIATAKIELENLKNGVTGFGSNFKAEGLKGSSTISSDTSVTTGLKSAAMNIDTSGIDDATKKHKDLLEVQKEIADFQQNSLTQGVQNLSGAFSTLGNAIGGTEGAMISMIGQMAQEVVQGVVTIASIKAQRAALDEKKNAALGSAAAGAMEAHSGIPFVGVALGIGMVATIVATLMSLPKFAEGGIVGGNSYSGDKILARLNSGEMVLTKQNQQNLMRVLNGGGSSATPSRGGEIKVQIENNKLVGTLRNASARASYHV